MQASPRVIWLTRPASWLSGNWLAISSAVLRGRVMEQAELRQRARLAIESHKIPNRHPPRKRPATPGRARSAWPITRTREGDDDGHEDSTTDAPAVGACAMSPRGTPRRAGTHGRVHGRVHAQSAGGDDQHDAPAPPRPPAGPRAEGRAHGSGGRGPDAGHLGCGRAEVGI